jgi:hypothetical protein
LVGGDLGEEGEIGHERRLGSPQRVTIDGVVLLGIGQGHLLLEDLHLFARHLLLSSAQ